MALDLGKEVGPLPLGAWIVVVAGGLGIALYSRNASYQSTPEIVDDTGSPDGVGDGSVGGWEQTRPTDPGIPQGITDNDQWANQAINYLIAQGYNPSWATSAISKYLAGGRGENRLSVREWALLNVALRKLGAPPYPIPGTPRPPTIKRPRNDDNSPGGGGGGNSPNDRRKHVFLPNPGNPDHCRKCKRARSADIHRAIARHRFTGMISRPSICRVCGFHKDRPIHDRKRTGEGRHTGPRRPVPGANSFKYATTRPGQSLKELAGVYYRDPSKWHLIFDANRAGIQRADSTPGLLTNPNVLPSGLRLIIPR